MIPYEDELMGLPHSKWVDAGDDDDDGGGDGGDDDDDDDDDDDGGGGGDDCKCGATSMLTEQV